MILFHKGIKMESIIEKHLKNIKQPILINNVIGACGKVTPTKQSLNRFNKLPGCEQYLVEIISFLLSELSIRSSVFR